jgi:class 3 adenylate cyclase/tetratricopeptide (TPR) repeat protein
VAVDIESWLRGLELEQYAAAFVSHEIDERVLPSLTANDLKELGVTLIGHRRRLLDAIAALRSGRPSTDVSIAAAIPTPPGQGAGGGAERRQLTVMFCDLVGSTALSTQIDPEDLRDLINAYHACCAERIARFGGYIAKYMGDGVLAYFGYPRAHEDDPIRAIHAGRTILGAISDLPWKTDPTPQVRIGIATGLVVVGDLIGEGVARESNVVGETPNLAARLQSLATPGSLVIADATRRLAGWRFEYRDLGKSDLKGFAGGIQAWQVTGTAAVESRFEALHGTALTPLVGRGEEIDLLLRRWQRAQAGEGQIVLLSGEAGIGKSRLTAVLQDRLSNDPHTKLRYFCSPHHKDSTLYPFIAQIERAVGFERDDQLGSKLDKLEGLLGQSGVAGAEMAGLFADLLGLPTDGRYPPPPQEPHRKREATLAALLTQLDALAWQRPVLMVFEDAHWADSTSLELLDRTVERAACLRALLVVTFRPEFVPPWTGQAHVSSLSLSRRAPRETGALVSGITAGKELPPEILEQIVVRTDGIPLFIEELTKSLLEGALLREEADSYALTGPLPPLAIPSSLQDSLMARLDRLEPVKEVAQISAALGREFSYELLAAVARRTDDDLCGALGQLTAAGLIFPRGTPPRATFMFKHALIQEAAYSTLLRSQRQNLHARIGRALEGGFPETLTMQPEILAHHFGQAGLLDTAITYWRKAGELALGRSADAEAVAHFSRGIELTQSLPAGYDRDQREFRLLLGLGSATRASKGQGAPETLCVYSRARELLSDTTVAKDEMAVLFGLSSVHFIRAEHVAAEDVACQALAMATRHEDPEALAFADRMMGITSWITGRFTEAVHHLERTVSLFGPGQQNITDLRYSQDHGVWALSVLALALFPLGFPEKAVEAAERARERAHEIQHAMTTGFAYAWGLTLDRQFRSEEQNLTLADEVSDFCNKHNLMGYIPAVQFYRGVALARAGDKERGLELMRQSVTAAEKINFRFLLPTLYAHHSSILATLGESDLAVNLLSQAIQMAEETHEGFSKAELYRLRGELLLDQDKAHDGVADLQRALVISQSQHARMWELRAATKLAEHWAARGKRLDARKLLTPVYGWFSEGFDTADLKQAKVLLDVL